MLPRIVAIALLLAPGAAVWSTPGSVSLRGRQTFTTKHLLRGHRYVLRTVGHCTRLIRETVREPGKDVERRVIETRADDTFGVDFRARVGDGEWLPLDVGGSPAETLHAFRAPTDDPQLTIADRSLHDEAELECSIGEISIRAE